MSARVDFLSNDLFTKRKVDEIYIVIRPASLQSGDADSNDFD